MFAVPATKPLLFWFWDIAPFETFALLNYAEFWLAPWTLLLLLMFPIWLDLTELETTG